MGRRSLSLLPLLLLALAACPEAAQAFLKGGPQAGLSVSGSSWFSDKLPQVSMLGPDGLLRGGSLDDMKEGALTGFRNGFLKLRATVSGSSAEEAKASKLVGNWKKVKEVGQDKAMLQLGLNYVFRKAAILLSNVRIRSSGDALEITTKGAVVVSIKETYKYNGEVSQCSRRDKRWGKHKGKIVSASDSKVVLDIKWDDPHGGVLKETFEVDKQGRLTHTSEIKPNTDATTNQPGQWYTYYSVYEKA